MGDEPFMDSHERARSHIFCMIQELLAERGITVTSFTYSYENQFGAPCFCFSSKASWGS
jgi:hypothetical protein